jgi:succinate dehydrogenase / fumarate reductase flavoprotein subunit
MQYAKSLPAAPENLAASFENEKKRQMDANQRLVNNQGNENPFQLWRELGDIMSKNVTVTRYNDKLQETDVKLVELLERYRKVNLSDKSMWSNQSFLFTRQLYNMLQLARVITQGAFLRNESRGSHYKPDFPERDDANFMKTTKAFFAPDADEPRFEFEPVDVSMIQPRPRRYDSK